MGHVGASGLVDSRTLAITRVNIRGIGHRGINVINHSVSGFWGELVVLPGVVLHGPWSPSLGAASTLGTLVTPVLRLVDLQPVTALDHIVINKISYSRKGKGNRSDKEMSSSGDLSSDRCTRRVEMRTSTYSSSLLHGTRWSA